jgi:hypothetical protein
MNYSVGRGFGPEWPGSENLTLAATRAVVWHRTNAFKDRGILLEMS